MRLKRMRWTSLNSQTTSLRPRGAASSAPQSRRSARCLRRPLQCPTMVRPGTCNALVSFCSTVPCRDYQARWPPWQHGLLGSMASLAACACFMSPMVPHKELVHGLKVSFC